MTPSLWQKCLALRAPHIAKTRHLERGVKKIHERRNYACGTQLTSSSQAVLTLTHAYYAHISTRNSCCARRTMIEQRGAFCERALVAGSGCKWTAEAESARGANPEECGAY
eukprot:3506586-Pleurochrysis_carterae.AAC.1